MMHELPLIIFTLLVQSSVGIVICTLLALMYANNSLDCVGKCRLARPAILVAFITGALGLTASTAHLGYPLNAFHALTHIGSSWLSREIVFASLYLAFLGLATLIALLKKRVFSGLLLIAALSGIIDIFCMSAIYVHASVVTWMHFNTYLMFYGSVLSLGTVICLGLMHVDTRLPVQLVKRVAIAAVTVVVVITLCRLLEQPAYVQYLAKMSHSTAITFPHQPLVAFEQLSRFMFISWLILVVGVGMLALSLRTQCLNKKLLLSGGALVIIAEICLRFIFFSIN